MQLGSIITKNLYLVIVFGDLNTNCGNQYNYGKATFKGSKLDTLTSQFGLKKLIFELNIQLTKSREEISSLYLALHLNFHHYIKFTKFNLKIVYPLPYEQELEQNPIANTDHIRQKISGFFWKIHFIMKSD